MNTEIIPDADSYGMVLPWPESTFAWSTSQSNRLARQAKLGQPASPDEALAELLAGNKRYVTGQNIHHDFGPERPALAQSQHPFAIILGCADSRVAPELAFDQSRGRLFVIRLAGNFVDDNGLASIEFGATVLGAFLIMVLGHNECGAVKAAVDVVTKNAQLPGHLPETRCAPESHQLRRLKRRPVRSSIMRSARMFSLTLKLYATPNRSLLIWSNKIGCASLVVYTISQLAEWKFSASVPRARPCLCYFAPSRRHFRCTAIAPRGWLWEIARQSGRQVAEHRLPACVSFAPLSGAFKGNR